MYFSLLLWRFKWILMRLILGLKNKTKNLSKQKYFRPVYLSRNNIIEVMILFISCVPYFDGNKFPKVTPTLQKYITTNEIFGN